MSHVIVFDEEKHECARLIRSGLFMAVMNIEPPIQSIKDTFLLYSKALSTAFIRLAGLTSEHPDVPFQKATPE